MRAQFKLLAVVVFVTAVGAHGQEPAKPQSSDDVLRINTELVQTGVSVVDKQGRFVDGLKKEDFELQVDGRPVSISFFENVVAGSYRDRLTRTPAKDEPAADERSLAITIRRRNIIFFIDDRHLSLDGVGRTRKALLDFINKQMGDSDLVAIASASGQIGFLQQFTSNKEVLRAAVDRLGHVPYVVTDYGQTPGTPMTEYMALTIERKDDPRVFDFYVQDCVKWAPKLPGPLGRSARVHCEVEVKNRARQILIQAASVTSSTYSSLETLLKSAERMPGSKLAFFFSDGFLADAGPRGPIANDRLIRMTDQARRAGVVIYTIDARGLISGELDATGSVPFDSAGRLESARLREIAATQDALHSLAVDTGGRALRNQNYFERFINEAVAETSRYYLIAWRPEPDGEKDQIRKIKVSIAGRADLTVRSARGFSNRTVIDATASDSAVSKEKAKDPQAKRPDANLQHALQDSLPTHGLPVQISLIYLDTPGNGALVTSSVQVLTDSLSYGEQGNDPARLTIAGVVVNDQGKTAGSFRTALKIDPPVKDVNQPPGANVIYNNPTTLKPGIYQVRVAARDDRSGLVGSAMEWIIVPDLATSRLSLSSLLVGPERVGANLPTERIQWSVDKKFSQKSRLRVMTFIYNAGAGGVANLTSQLRVYRDGRAVLSQPRTRVPADAQTDVARIPFMSEIDLTQLQTGAYSLEVTVEDVVTHKTASQHTTFYVR